MIPEWDTNILYFSNLFPNKYPYLFEQIEYVLKLAQIDYCLIPSTRDIWCRDYMPLQVEENKFVQFRYDPSYLKDFPELKTDPESIVKAMGINCFNSSINLDGGNIVYCSNFACITDKMFLENDRDPDELLEQLKEELQLSDIFVFPKQPYDIYGHIDSMVRFLDEATLLINDFSKESKNYRNKIEKVLQDLPFKVLHLEVKVDHRFSWAYLNYIQVGKFVILPVLGISEDKLIIEQFETLFEDGLVYPVKATSLTKKGGALHCISWNRKK